MPSLQNFTIKRGVRTGAYQQITHWTTRAGIKKHPQINSNVRARIVILISSLVSANAFVPKVGLSKIFGETATPPREAKSSHNRYCLPRHELL
jgi:hypothetical protein